MRCLEGRGRLTKIIGALILFVLAIVILYFLFKGTVSINGLQFFSFGLVSIALIYIGIQMLHLSNMEMNAIMMSIVVIVILVIAWKAKKNLRDSE